MSSSCSTSTRVTRGATGKRGTSARHGRGWRCMCLRRGIGWPLRVILEPVGQRSSTDTVIGLVQAFLERRTWTQADLARRLEMGVPAVKKRLEELAGAFNLEREEDHPHIYWSVPKNWFPGGVLFAREQLPDLLRQLSRLPRGKT